ncbi:Histone-lysine N-methyltransferase ASHH1 [Zea mays]|nr:Histone-lysine N-methyltransferase ASHH1 [Zea mays]
MPDELVL